MSEIETPHIQKPYRVLSLDGGGMRGIYTAAFFDRLLGQFEKTQGRKLDPGHGFDLITGTSTGAIVACAVAIQRPMSDIVSLYRIHGPRIFPHRIKGKRSAIYWAFRGRTFVRRGDGALREALAGVLGTTTMADVFRDRGISLSIPAVDMSTHHAWVFKKTPKSGPRDDDYPLVDVDMRVRKSSDGTAVSSRDPPPGSQISVRSGPRLRLRSRSRSIS